MRSSSVNWMNSLCGKERHLKRSGNTLVLARIARRLSKQVIGCEPQSLQEMPQSDREIWNLHEEGKRRAAAEQQREALAGHWRCNIPTFVREHAAGGGGESRPSQIGSMLSCKDSISLVMDFLNGEMSVEEESHLRKHLEGCPSCSDFMNTYRADPRRRWRTVVPRGNEVRPQAELPSVGLRLRPHKS